MLNREIIRKKLREMGVSVFDVASLTQSLSFEDQVALELVKAELTRTAVNTQAEFQQLVNRAYLGARLFLAAKLLRESEKFLRSPDALSSIKELRALYTIREKMIQTPSQATPQETLWHNNNRDRILTEAAALIQEAE